jgi:hypothetical protein
MVSRAFARSAHDQARCGCVERPRRAVDLGRQRGDSCLARGAPGPIERAPCRLCADAPHRYPSGHQPVSGP